MEIQLNNIYLVGVLIPNVLNDPSPAMGIPASSHTVDMCPGSNSFSIQRHLCIIAQYDPVTRIGVMFLGTSSPEQAHRFVPCEGTPRLPYQPVHEVRLSPSGGFSHMGYFNFTHALRATIITQQNPTQPNIPPQAFLSDKYADEVSIGIFVSDAEMAGLKALQMSYWEGVRYTEDGLPIEGAGTRAGGGLVGESGGVDFGLNMKECSIEIGRPINPDGSLHQRAINADGTVTLTLEEVPSAEDGSGSERLARALKEEDERMEPLEQLDMLGEQLLQLDPPTALAFIEPLTMQALEFVDSF